LGKLQNVNPGIRADHVLTLRVSLPEARYSHDEQTVQFFERTVEQVRALPGVISASAISHLPFNGIFPGTWVQISGEAPARPGEEKVASIRTVLPGYFRTMGIPLLAGRDFNDADNRVSAPLQFIVSRQFVEKFLRNSNPLDKQLKVWMARNNPFGQIVGVADDVHDETLEDEPSATVYYPHAQLAYDQMVILAHTNPDPLSFAAPVRRIVRSIDSAQPIADVRTMDEVVATTFSRQHFSALLLAGFSCASLLLAAIGVYGILAYWVSERVREIGVRVAVGATPANIMSLVFRSAAVPVMVGVAAGITGALALAGLIRTLLFGIGPHDPVTLALAPVTLALVALLAAWIPSRRAAALDPACALRAG
jgi:putative ABC transport system permease protein